LLLPLAELRLDATYGNVLYLFFSSSVKARGDGITRPPS
jgi:hypothetical protein